MSNQNNQNNQIFNGDNEQEMEFLRAFLMSIADNQNPQAQFTQNMQNNQRRYNQIPFSPLSQLNSRNILHQINLQSPINSATQSQLSIRSRTLQNRGNNNQQQNFSAYNLGQDMIDLISQNDQINSFSSDVVQQARQRLAQLENNLALRQSNNIQLSQILNIRNDQRQRESSNRESNIQRESQQQQNLHQNQQILDIQDQNIELIQQLFPAQDSQQNDESNESQNLIIPQSLVQKMTRYFKRFLKNANQRTSDNYKTYCKAYLEKKLRLLYEIPGRRSIKMTDNELEDIYLIMRHNAQIINDYLEERNYLGPRRIIPDFYLQMQRTILNQTFQQWRASELNNLLKQYQKRNSRSVQNQRNRGRGQRNFENRSVQNPNVRLSNVPMNISIRPSSDQILDNHQRVQQQPIDNQIHPEQNQNQQEIQQQDPVIPNQNRAVVFNEEEDYYDIDDEEEQQNNNLVDFSQALQVIGNLHAQNPIGRQLETSIRDQIVPQQELPREQRNVLLQQQQQQNQQQFSISFFEDVTQLAFLRCFQNQSFRGDEIPDWFPHIECCDLCQNPGSSRSDQLFACPQCCYTICLICYTNMINSNRTGRWKCAACRHEQSNESNQQFLRRLLLGGKIRRQTKIANYDLKRWLKKQLVNLGNQMQQSFQLILRQNIPIIALWQQQHPQVNQIQPNNQNQQVEVIEQENNQPAINELNQQIQNPNQNDEIAPNQNQQIPVDQQVYQNSQRIRLYLEFLRNRQIQNQNNQQINQQNNQNQQNEDDDNEEGNNDNLQ